MKAAIYWANVMLIDNDTHNQIGECWIVEARATTKAEATREIRRKAWEDVDTRVQDAHIEVLDGPTRGRARGYADEKEGG